MKEARRARCEVRMEGEGREDEILRISSLETCSERRGEVSQGVGSVGEAEERESQHCRIHSDPWCLPCRLCFYRCPCSYTLLATVLVDTRDDI